MLAPEDFDRTLRAFLGSDPFVPFVVEMDGGERILIKRPELAFGGGGATLFDPGEGVLIDFNHRQVIGFTPYSEQISQ